MKPNYVGKRAIDHRKNCYTEGEIIKINTQDSHGLYYEFDGKQWIVYWSEFDELEFLDGQSGN
jgi:hypothetical protein